MRRILPRILILSALLCAWALCPSFVRAYTFSEVNPDTKTPVGFDANTTVKYMIDPGPFGTLSNDDLLALVQEGFNIWSSLEGTNLPSFEFVGFLDEDVTGENFTSFVPDGVCYTDDNPLNEACENYYIENEISLIIFDEDRTIADDNCFLFACLGKAFRSKFSGSNSSPVNIKQANIFISTNSTNLRQTLGLLVHELGHFFGLSHTSVNQQFLENTFEDFSVSFSKNVPTMISIKEGGLGIDDHKAFPNPDDQLGIQTLYPKNNLENETALVRGKVIDEEGNPVFFGNVIARNIEDPLCKAYSFVVGRYDCETAFENTCDENADAEFVFNYLPPGTYTFEIEGYLDNVKAYSIYAGLDEESFTGAAELWNENDIINEDYLSHSSLTVEAGDTIEDLQFIVKAKDDSSPIFITEDFFEIPNITSCQEVSNDYLLSLVNSESVNSSNGNSSNTVAGCSLIIP